MTHIKIPNNLNHHIYNGKEPYFVFAIKAFFVSLSHDVN